MKSALSTLAVSGAFGFILSRIGFTSWDEVHRMFTVADLRLTLTFMAAVAILMVGMRVAARAFGLRWKKVVWHPGIVPGGILFGLGWALSGACPSICLVQLGEGQLAALATLAGVFAGAWLYGIAHARFFRWNVSSSCGED